MTNENDDATMTDLTSVVTGVLGMVGVEEKQQKDEGIRGNAASRAMEIEQLNREIEERKERVKKLSQDHSEHIRKMRLLLNSEEVYKNFESYVSTADKKKENVLLALQSEKIPNCMKWSAPVSFFSRHYRLQTDREVLLARLALDDFEASFINEPFEVPSKFRNDKEVMMIICSKNCEALRYASNKLKADPELVLAAIQHEMHLAPLAIRHASNKIRADKKIVQVAINRAYGIRAVKFIHPKLQKDKRLILTSIRRSSDECNRHYETLSELPESLRKDEAIVVAALKKRGSNLRFVASPELLSDLDVVLTACKQDGGALAYVPEGPTKRELLEEPEYLHMIVANGGYAVLDNENYDVRQLVMADMNLLLAAVQTTPEGFFYNIEDLVQNDSSFLLKLLVTNSNLYANLSKETKQRSDVAMACLGSEALNEQRAAEILRHHPKLQSDLDLITVLAAKGFQTVLAEAPESVQDDKNVMMVACSAEGSMLSVATERLQRDPDVVSTAVRSDPDVIFTLPKELLRESPAIAEAAIRAYDGDKIQRLLEHLPKKVFQHRNVLLAWLKRENWPQMANLVNSGLVQGWYREDREVLMAIAKYQGSFRYLGIGGIYYVPDPSFLKSCLAVEGRVLWGSGRSFEGDYELLLVAIASNRMALFNSEWFHQTDSYSFDIIAKFAREVRALLETSDAFILTFLRGISTFEQHCAPAKRCQLPHLDTGNDIKRLIAQFADIPLGTELLLLRSALENLEFWGY